MLTKKELRKNIREEKIKQSADNLRILSGEVVAKLEQHPAFKSADTVLAYYSLPDEVDTHAFIQKWAGEKKFLLPVINDNGEMEIKTYQNPEQLVSGGLGISEPTGEVYTAYDQIDLVIVPGMAFSREGYRLGRGKGYYDRFLPMVKAYKIGICFPFQLVGEIPCDEHDFRMDEVLF